MAEGAIDGTASQYELPGPHSTHFAFSRFDRAYLAAPVSGALAGASGEASSTERE